MASTRREGGAEGWEETRVVARLTTRVQGEGTGLRPRRDKTRTVHRPQNRSGSPRRALRGGGQCGRVETKRQAVENDRAVAEVTDKAREWESSVELSAVKRASRKSRQGRETGLWSDRVPGAQQRGTKGDGHGR